MFTSSARTYVNAVNCVGVMGAGIAKAFRDRYPSMYADYLRRCQQNELALGQPVLYLSSERNIISFPTKHHFRNKTNWDNVEAGLIRLQENISKDIWTVDSLAVPALGCSLGGLDWKTYRKPLAEALSALPVPVELFVPHARR